MRTRNLLTALGTAALGWAYYQRSYRYRDPVRLPPAAEGLTAPVDGTVAFVRRTEGTQGAQGEGEAGWQMGVALNPLSVRYVYAPQDGQAAEPMRGPVTVPQTLQGVVMDGLTLTLVGPVPVTVTLAAQQLGARSYFAAGEPVRRGNKLAFLERGDLVVLNFGAEFRPVVRVGEAVVGAQTLVAEPIGQ